MKPILVVAVKYHHHENGLFLFHPILEGVVGEYAYDTLNNEPHGLKLNKTWYLIFSLVENFTR